MEKQRGTTIAVVAALVVAVISLGVAFATFSQVLNINGTATIQASSWDIYFAESDFSNNTAPSKPAANATVTTMNTSSLVSGYTPTVDTTNTSATYSSPTAITWQAALKSPEDRVVWEFYAVNAGTYNAQVNNTPGSVKVGVTDFTCTKGGSTETDVCSHIHYGVYTDSTLSTPVSNSTTLAAGQAQKYYLAVWLDTTYGGEGGATLADATVTTATITTTITYGQVQ